MNGISLETKKFILNWLKITLFMVLAMVLIGGVTRLTDSGLSMVEWKPILGTIPPLSNDEWLEAFAKYKNFPEFKKVNSQMSLSEFQFIYFWEYFHRLFGRLIGLVFFLPLIYLVARKRLNKEWFLKLFLALILGGSQGLLGWFMVKSGLVDRPDVSHLRLAAHFSLALFIMSYIFWLIIDLKFDLKSKSYSKSDKIQDRFSAIDVKTNSKFLKILNLFALVLIIQIVYGAFVAGLDAGMLYNTFPLMGKKLIPSFLYGADINTFIHGNAGVQFVHRVLAVILLTLAAYIHYLAYRYFSKISKITHASYVNEVYISRALNLLAFSVYIQFILGAYTIVLKVPLLIASMHQICACFVVLFWINSYKSLKYAKNKNIFYNNDDKESSLKNSSEFISKVNVEENILTH